MKLAIKNKDLPKQDLNIGDKVKLEESLNTNRDYPFVYINGEIILDEKLDTHTGILTENEEIINTDIPIAMGYVIDDIAIILPYYIQNCTLMEIADALKEQYNISAIYISDGENIPVVEKVAKL